MQAKIAFYLKPSAITQSLKMKTIPVIPTFEYELFFDGCSKGNPGPAGAPTRPQ